MIVVVLAVIVLVMMAGFMIGMLRGGASIPDIVFAIGVLLIGSICLVGMVNSIEKSNFDLALKCAENGIECVVIDIDTFEKRLSKEVMLRAEAGESIDIKSVLSFVSEKDSN